MAGCKAPTVIVGGVTMSTSDAENAQALLEELGGDNGDPTFDEYNSNIAGGNNANGANGVQVGNPSTQTSLPGPNTTPPFASDDKVPPYIPGKDVGCPLSWDPTAPNAYDYQLSPNFKVRDFSINAFFPNQVTTFAGLEPKDRVCNLMALAVNVAEPLLAKFGKFRINSSIRNQETCPGPNHSQHTQGMAMDIQFPGWSLDKYWEMAPWIRDNLPYDQMIYEYSDKSGSVWYHLSYNQAGNRKPGDPLKVMTMWHNKYDHGGLKRYA